MFETRLERVSRGLAEQENDSSKTRRLTFAGARRPWQTHGFEIVGVFGGWNGNVANALFRVEGVYHMEREAITSAPAVEFFLGW